MKKLTIILSLFLCSISLVNAQQWDTLSSGIGGSANIVLALTQYNGNLIAGRIYTGNIALWNGINWDTLGFSNSQYIPSDIWAECVYKDTLIVAGEYLPNWGISQWNGILWDTLKTSEYNSIGISEIHALIIYQGNLYACGMVGKNVNSANTIAIWNGNNWDTVMLTRLSSIWNS